MVGQSYTSLYLQILNDIPAGKKIDIQAVGTDNDLKIDNAFVQSSRGGWLYVDYEIDPVDLILGRNGEIAVGVFNCVSHEPFEFQEGYNTTFEGSFEENEFAYENLGVDLELPSGKLWSSLNVGSEYGIITDMGEYFSWGNIDGVYGAEASQLTEDAYAGTPGAALTGDIPLTHDAANNYFGNGWRMPTSEEFKELHDNCDWTWKQVNGVYGYEVKSKASGNTNSIFLPAAGYVDDGSLGNVGSYGDYWSSSYRGEDGAYILDFYAEDVIPDSGNDRYCGCTVRAIHDANV